MALSQTFASLGRLIRRAPPPPAELLEAYAHEVIPVLDRAEWLYQYWLEQSTLFSDSEKLGNVAAIHRWETATMGRSLEKVIPPAVLAGAHADVIDALEMASRAAQLLSSGSRFHNANAVCEGQSMLGTSRTRRLAALRSMRRYLGRLQVEATHDPVALTPPTVPPPVDVVEAESPEAALDIVPAVATAGDDDNGPPAPLTSDDGATPALADPLTVPDDDVAWAPADSQAEPDDDAPPASPPAWLDPAWVPGTAAAETSAPLPDVVPDEAQPQTTAQAPKVDEAQHPVRPGWGTLFDQQPPSPPAPRP